MAKKKNLSEVPEIHFPGIKEVKIGIVTSSWNREITSALQKGASDYLASCGIPPENIVSIEVPGSFELPLGAQYLFEQGEVDGIVSLGCIIQGETRHFEFIADAVSHGINEVGRLYNSPVGFGVLTTNTYEQALERAGGKHGNKGIEAAATVLSMLKIKISLGLDDYPRE